MVLVPPPRLISLSARIKKRELFHLFLILGLLLEFGRKLGLKFMLPLSMSVHSSTLDGGGAPWIEILRFVIIVSVGWLVGSGGAWRRQVTKKLSIQ